MFFRVAEPNRECSMPKAALLVALLLSSSCVGALAGGTFGGPPPRLWGAVDVLVVAADGSPRADVPVRAAFNAEAVDDVTDATGHVRLMVTWLFTRSAHDASGNFLAVRVSLPGQPSTAVIVRPAVVSPVTLILTKGQTR